MPKIDLATAKLHLRDTSDAENLLIDAWIAAAYLAVEGQIFRKIYADGAAIPTTDTTGIYSNDIINAAVLLIVGHLSANREAVTSNVGGHMVALPMGVDWLLTPYINCAGGV